MREKKKKSSDTEIVSTFNQCRIHFLFRPEEAVKEAWKNRVTCSICFLKNFFHDRNIILPDVNFNVYVLSNFSETKAILFERSQGNFHLQLGAAAAVVKGALYSQQNSEPFMDVHEFVHILIDKLTKNESDGKFWIPMWFSEGLAQYIQGKKMGIDYLNWARESKNLPNPFLKNMNWPTEKSWLEFGVMKELVKTNNHPGLTACASLVAFLSEKEKIPFYRIMNLIFSRNFNDFYLNLEKISRLTIFDLFNNYLYYIDKPMITKGVDKISLPVSVGTDFREEFIFEEKEFELAKELLS